MPILLLAHGYDTIMCVYNVHDGLVANGQDIFSKVYRVKIWYSGWGSCVYVKQNVVGSNLALH